MKQQDNTQVNEDIDIDTKESNKTEEIADVETNLYKESVLSLDISDIDLDELVQQEIKTYVTVYKIYIYVYVHI